MILNPYRFEATQLGPLTEASQQYVMFNTGAGFVESIANQQYVMFNTGAGFVESIANQQYVMFNAESSTP